MAALAESSEVPGAPSSAAAKARLAGLLGRRLRFTLSDERVVVGVFQCVDRLRNFIVTDARGTAASRTASAPSIDRACGRRLETRPFHVTRDGEDLIEERRRSLGSVLVPGKHLLKVEALGGDWAEAAAALPPDAPAAAIEAASGGETAVSS